MAVHGALGHAGPAGDVAQAGLRADGLERRPGRGKDLRAVVTRVGAEHALVHRR